MKTAIQVALVVGATAASVPSIGAGAAPSFLSAPSYSRTLVGPGLASMYPVDVADDSQYYFVIDAGRYRLLAVNRSTDNIDFQTGGLQGSGPGQFGDARAIYYDTPNNLVLVADTPNNRVEVFSFSSTSGFTYLESFGGKGSGNGQFNQAYGVAVDPVNNWVYAVDGAGRVEKFLLNPSVSPPTVAYSLQFGNGTLVQPRQVAVAPNGDVFVTNRESALKKSPHDMCYVYTSSGTLLFHFGSGGTGNGQFTNDPRGISISADGTLAFATDSGGKRVEAFTLTQSGGHYSSAAWSYSIPSGTGNAALVGPRGLTTTSNNHLMVTDEWGFNLHEYSFTPGTTTYTSTYNSTPAPPPVPGVDSPRGVQVASNGQIYIMDYWNQRVEYTNADGTGAQTFGFRGDPSQNGAINFAWGIALQPGTGDVFVANRESDQVESFSPSGTAIAIYGKKGTALGDFSFPQGIAFDPTNGTLLVDDSGNDRIERCTLSSGDTSLTCTTSYGTKDSGSKPFPAGELNVPTGIAVAPDGTIWVADTLNNRVQSISTSGTWTAIASVSGISPKTFNVPWGVTVAPDGSVWISDTGNNRIVSMQTNGTPVFSANEASMGIPTVPADSVIFPFALTFDSSNHVYLSDIWNDRVVVLTTS
ncbi:MAG: NHL repeat-containing protein [Candidatus Dormibacteria bacterium]